MYFHRFMCRDPYFYCRFIIGFTFTVVNDHNLADSSFFYEILIARHS